MEHDVTARMLEILRLDPGASLRFSTWTGKWYVESNLHIGDGGLITGVAEHRDTPEEAVTAMLARLQSHGIDEYVTNGRSGDDRRNWRRAGVVFREVSTEELRRKYAR